MHAEAKAALVRRILLLESDTLSEEDYATEYDRLYAQLLRNRIWERKFSKTFLDGEIRKLLDSLRGENDDVIVAEHLDQFIAQIANTPWNFVVEVGEQDYRPLDTFPLKWRWTDARWNILPADALANIRPLVPAKASEVDEKTSVFNPDEGFLPGTYQLIDEIESEHNDEQVVRDWLRSYIPNLEGQVIVCWNLDNAVVTKSSIFCYYWDDFCYPASDDVSISPLSGEWLLFYWHEEVFFFGQLGEG